MVKPRDLATVLVLFFCGTLGEASEVSTVINEFSTDPSRLFATATFDFGVAFSRIDAVSLEILIPEGLSGGGCSGSTCNSSSIAVVLHRGDDSVDFSDSPASPSMSFDPTQLRAAFGYVTPGWPTETRLLPPNPRFNLETGEFSSDPWPAFLLSGRGVISMQKRDTWSCYLNCSGSGESLSAPTGVSSIRVIVQGAVVPEPQALSILTVGTCLISANLRSGSRKYQNES